MSKDTQAALVAYELPGGGSITFETDPAYSHQSSDYRRPLSSQSAEPEQAAETFESALKHLTPVAQTVLDALKALNSPDEIGIEFGLKLGHKAGVVVASANTDVQFKVSLKWKNESTKNNDAGLAQDPGAPRTSAE